mgnify:CR=1 FL=1
MIISCEIRKTTYAPWTKLQILSEYDTMINEYVLSEKYIEKKKKESERQKVIKYNSNIGEVTLLDYLNSMYPPISYNRYSSNIHYVSNESLDSLESESSNHCLCQVNSDTLFIKLAWDLFDGEKYEFELLPNGKTQFIYSEYHHELEAFPIDSSFSNSKDEMSLEINEYKLIFEEKPNFESNQEIKGYFKFNTPNYNFNMKFLRGKEKNNLSVYRTGEVIFKCRTQQKIILKEKI